MDASVVISAINRHICHTVNIVNVINFFVYLRLYVNIFYFNLHLIFILCPLISIRV